MKKDTVYVVTDSDMGWDCVVDVCLDKKFAQQTYKKDCYHIFEMSINNSIYKNPDSKIPKEDNKNEFFRVISKSESDKKNYYFIMDTLEISHGKFQEENSLDSMLLIVNEWDRFCKHNKIDCGQIFIVKHKFEGNDYDSFYPVCSGLKEEDDPEEINITKFYKWLEEKNIRAE